MIVKRVIVLFKENIHKFLIIVATAQTVTIITNNKLQHKCINLKINIIREMIIAKMAL